MLSGSFPIFALSNHTTFSQTQTGATVPLKSIGDSLGNYFLEYIEKCLYKSENPLGACPTMSPDVLIYCMKMKNHQKKLPAVWKQGDPLSVLHTISDHFVTYIGHFLSIFSSAG